MVNTVYGSLRFTGLNEVDRVCAVMVAYLDDLAVRSDTVDQHLTDWHAVFDRTLAAGFRMKLSKCLFGKKAIELLGHKVTAGKILPSDGHASTFDLFHEPRNASELLRFIGLVGFFGEHVESAADRIAPLFDVLIGTGWNKKKNKRRKVVVQDWAARWGESQSRAFHALREILANPDFLVAPRPEAEKMLVSDASIYGLGVVLLQWEGEELGWLPIAFASRKQEGAEARYTVTEKECLAVLFGLKKFREHLYGEKFCVVTDHAALVWLMSLRDPKHRLARWILEFQAFDFDVQHAPGDGSLLSVPDALSRDTMSKDLCSGWQYFTALYG
jgi:uncharacterized glyoxalase superfamily protein PhnB